MEHEEAETKMGKKNLVVTLMEFSVSGGPSVGMMRGTGKTQEGPMTTLGVSNHREGNEQLVGPTGRAVG